MALPPTSTKGSGDANPVTTFEIDFPNNPITHTGVKASIGATTVAGGGTGAATLAAHGVVIGNGTSAVNVVTPGTAGTVLTSNGASADPTYQTNPGAITNNYFSGYMSSSSSWSFLSPTYVDGTNSGGNALTTIYSNGLTVTAAASSLPGITFTPSNSSAVYEIVAILTPYNSTGVDNVSAFRITDGTTALAWGGGITYSSNNKNEPLMTLTCIYAPGTTSAVTIKIQGLSTSGTTYIDQANFDSSVPVIQWRVIQIK